MRYLAITQKTADWLLKNKDILKAVTNELQSLSAMEVLKEGAIVIGAFYACKRNNVLAIWNSDYLSSSGVEDWGFFILDGDAGLLSTDTIIEVVFERELLLTSLRLQGLLLPDDRFIHRSHGDGISTCLSGRGSTARHFSIGYKEGIFRANNYESKSLLCLGPWGGAAEPLVAKVREQSKHISALISAANKLIAEAPKRPSIDSKSFIGIRQSFASDTTRRKEKGPLPVASMPELQAEDIKQEISYQTLDWTYDDWIREDSPLTEAQRKILDSDVLYKQPLRIIGAAGSGKSLLMQLLCIRQLAHAKETSSPATILYVVHNNEMADSITERFKTLGAGEYVDQRLDQRIEIRTLFGYAQQRLNLLNTDIIDKDAYQTKSFQLSIIIECIDEVAARLPELVVKDKLLSHLADPQGNRTLYAEIISTEIGVAIKGRDLTRDKTKYLKSEKPLSRFHGALNASEKEFVYEVFLAYHRKVFDEFEVLDSDDVALTLLGHLRTPLWEMRRKKEGYDFVFVDETQLFNENERQLLHLLTKAGDDYVPIALALDEAQSLYGAISAGFATLGIENISNQKLNTVHRCTSDILKLAFFVIQRTTDLFTNEFPNFTSSTVTLVPDDHRLAAKPKIVTQPQDSDNLPKAVLKEVRSMRKHDLRQIAIIVHSDRYWNDLITYFKNPSVDLPWVVHSIRGERLDQRRPIVAITKPEFVGGHEYDGVITVGIEKGLVPPPIKNHSGLEVALEQQSLRELYLSFTRAKYRLVIFISKNSLPSTIITDAATAGFVKVDQ